MTSHATDKIERITAWDFRFGWSSPRTRQAMNIILRREKSDQLNCSRLATRRKSHLSLSGLNSPLSTIPLFGSIFHVAFLTTYYNSDRLIEHSPTSLIQECVYNPQKLAQIDRQIYSMVPPPSSTVLCDREAPAVESERNSRRNS